MSERQRCGNDPCLMCDHLDEEYAKAHGAPAPLLSVEVLESVRRQVLAMTPTYQPPILSSPSMAEQYARLIRGESSPKE